MILSRLLFYRPLARLGICWRKTLLWWRTGRPLRALYGSILLLIATITRSLPFPVLLLSLGGGMIARAVCIRAWRSVGEANQFGVAVGLVLFSVVTIGLRLWMMEIERRKDGRGRRDGGDSA